MATTASISDPTRMAKVRPRSVDPRALSVDMTVGRFAASGVFWVMASQRDGHQSVPSGKAATVIGWGFLPACNR